VLIMWLWAALVAFGTVLVSLYTGTLMWTVLGIGTAVTIALTFLVPVLQKPQMATADAAPGEPAEGLPEEP